LNQRRKKEGWTAGKEAHIQYEKILSKYLKEKKAAAKKEAAETNKLAKKKSETADGKKWTIGSSILGN